MMTHHVGETAKRLLLQKLVVKMQERVFDVILPWYAYRIDTIGEIQLTLGRNESALVNPRMRENITNIYQSFTSPLVAPDLQPQQEAMAEDEDATTRFLMLTPLDIIGFAQILCPDRAASQSLADQGTTIIASDRPSTAGSSTLVAGSSDIGSVSLAPPIKATAIDPSSSETTMIGPATENEDSHDSARGDFKTPAKTKEMLTKDFDLQVTSACQKLRDISVQTRNPSSGVTSNPWNFIYYSKDCATLHMDPVGVDTPHQAGAGFSTLEQSDMDLDRGNQSNAYQILKAAVIALLSEDNIDHLRSAEQSTMAQCSGPPDSFDILGTLMETAMAKAQFHLDFINSHHWWRNFQIHRKYLESHSTKSSRTLLNDISEDLRGSAANAANVTKYCDVQCRSLRTQQRNNRTILAQLEDLRNSLRIKMWYVSDVRNSGIYEEALYVTRALRTMATSRRPKQPSSVSSWARQRFRGSNLHGRAEDQTLEAISAPKEFGGMSKLADEQVELTSRWLTRKSIENFCKGEERIHRFCYEVQRSVGRIAGASPLENPVLWSSNLFKRERALHDMQKSKSRAVGSPLTPSLTPPALFDAGRIPLSSLGTSGFPPRAGTTMSDRSFANQFGGFWNPNQAMLQPAGLGLYGHRPALPPTPTSPPMSWTNSAFGPDSPLHTATPPMPYDSISSFGSSQGKNGEDDSPAKKAFVEQTGKKLCSLLLSDLGYLLWSKGSETDAWVNDHIDDNEDAIDGAPLMEVSIDQTSGAAEANKLIDTMPHQHPASDNTTSRGSFPTAALSDSDQNSTAALAAKPFPYFKTFASLLRKMSLTTDPYKKLLILHELQDLVVKSLDRSHETRPTKHYLAHSLRFHGRLSLRSKSVPRTKTTSLEEVIANCTERRAGTLRSEVPKAPFSVHDLEWGSLESCIPSADDIVNQLYSIFRDHGIRSTTLFRDLQYIAAFVPAKILDQTAQGKAFWDAGLAALALKEDLCEWMVGRANTITAYHMSPQTSLVPNPDGTLSSTTLRDAANLLLITAREGSPVAARELGLFYLTHPELLIRVTMPFSKAKTVFKSVVSNDARAGDKEKGALDPYTFAVVFHWMEIAANSGDKDAKDFLKGNGELSGGR